MEIFELDSGLHRRLSVLLFCFKLVIATCMKTIARTPTPNHVRVQTTQQHLYPRTKYFTK
jgi:hypothetical protein